MAIPWEPTKDEIHSNWAQDRTHEKSSPKDTDANALWLDAYIPKLNETEKVAAGLAEPG
jgi:hypothetical protein